MIIVVAGTSGLLAALDSSHPERETAQEASTAAGLLVLSPIDDIRGWMRRGRVSVPEITEERLGVAQ